MPIDFDNVADLIRRFEPILFFHPDERFFPSDAKRYIESCKAWTVNGSKHDDKLNWGGSGPRNFPRHAKFTPPISAAEGEPGADLNAPLDGVEELFLDLTGWRDGKDVTKGSANSFANLDEISDLYGTAFGDGLNKHLEDSRFWYHAEVFDQQRMRPLVGAKADPNLMEGFLALPTDSVLVCYNLFFPGSDGGLEGCDDDFGTKHPELFDNHAGQWTCIAVLLEGTTPPGIGQKTDYKPTFLGMTSRSPDVVTTPQTEARHFGMKATDWSIVRNVKRDRGPGHGQGEHPLVFVARQTHGYYLEPGPQQTLAPRANDFGRNSCGWYETLEQVTTANADADARDAGIAKQDEKNSLFKWFLIFGGPIGFFISLAYSGGFKGLANIADENDPRPPVAPGQLDHPPDAGNFGFVVRPQGVTLPDPQAGRKVEWPLFNGVEANMATSINAREYRLMVGSKLQPFTRPPWLPSDDHKTGFRGRWGNRVTADPQDRRVGMEFLEFWQLFILALRKAKSMP
jgi:hypothetical protein